MLRYKGFDSALFGDNMAQFEMSVNDWLQRQRPHVRFVAQSAHGDHFVLSFLYDSGDEERRVGRANIAPEMLRDEDEDEDPGADVMQDPGLPEAELPY